MVVCPLKPLYACDHRLMHDVHYNYSIMCTLLNRNKWRPQQKCQCASAAGWLLNRLIRQWEIWYQTIDIGFYMIQRKLVQIKGSELAEFHGYACLIMHLNPKVKRDDTRSKCVCNHNISVFKTCERACSRYNLPWLRLVGFPRWNLLHEALSFILSEFNIHWQELFVGFLSSLTLKWQTKRQDFSASRGMKNASYLS